MMMSGPPVKALAEQVKVLCMRGSLPDLRPSLSAPVLTIFSTRSGVALAVAVNVARSAASEIVVFLSILSLMFATAMIKVQRTAQLSCAAKH